MFDLKNELEFKVVIFDFDYTLADSSKGVFESVLYALVKMGYPRPGYEEVCKTIGLHLCQTFALLTGNTNDDDAEKFVGFFKEKADEVMTKKTIVYNDVRPLFDHFALYGIKCAIVSTKFRYRIKDILDRDGLTGFIEVIIGGEDVRKPKPDPEGLHKAIKSLGIRKEDCLYTGDSLVDAKTAKNAGVGFVAVLTGTTKRTEFEEYSPLYILEKLDEMKGILK